LLVCLSAYLGILPLRVQYFSALFASLCPDLACWHFGYHGHWTDRSFPLLFCDGHIQFGPRQLMCFHWCLPPSSHHLYFGWCLAPPP
jgi:hypothetical protein